MNLGADYKEEIGSFSDHSENQTIFSLGSVK